MTMTSHQLPVDALPAWAILNSVDLAHVRVQNIEGRGCGVVACRGISSRPVALQVDVDSAGHHGHVVMIRVSRDCVLSAEAVDECSKINQNFRELLEVIGYHTTRGKIMLYLLTQIVLSKGSQSTSKGAPLTPWTEYVKFLPHRVPLPTMWSVKERQLLVGTSLESALRAKLSVLVDEFYHLRKMSLDLHFWYALFWENETASLEDWVLADALYRSRCLELPQSGEAMVPVLDMANHSSTPNAYYDEDENGNVVLLMRQGCDAHADQEITISYGSQKSAAEMLFSYGFVDESSLYELTLPLDTLPDDPLGKAKLRVLRGPPTLRLWKEGESFKWDSPSAFLLCLNEEDGLDFRVLQHTSGERELRLLWGEEDVTDQSGDFERLIQHHPLCQVFKLRVIVTLLGKVTMQLNSIQEVVESHIEDLQDDVNEDCTRAAEALKRVEASVLKGVAEALEQEKAVLLTDEQVVDYLESMQGLQEDQQRPEQGSDTAAYNEDEDDDFS